MEQANSAAVRYRRTVDDGRALESRSLFEERLENRPYHCDANPILSNGQHYPLAPVTMEPSGTAIVDIGQGLASLGIAPYATLCGYAEIEYQWAWAAVTATIKNVDIVNSLIYIFSLQPSPDWHPEHMESMPATLPTSFEGLWWKQEKDVSGFLALSNVTGQAIHAAVRLTDKSEAQLASYQVTVSPHGTKILTLDELKTAEGDTGGVYLTHDGPERGLDINGGLQDQAVGYSAQLRMRPQLQPASSSQPQLPQPLSFSELGLMTGAADPMMNFPSGTVFTAYSVVRNISEQDAAVTPELWWMSGGSPHSVTLPQLTISLHQTMNLNVPALLAAAGLKNFNGSENLILDTKAQAGGLLLSSGSVDQKNTYVFEVIPYGVAESSSKALCYWSTGNGDDTMVTLWNPADEAQDLAFTLFYTGGQYVYPIQLGPRGTRSFNVSEILHTPTPDAAGNVIPAGITEGSAEIAGSLGEQQHILISLDAAVYNVRKAICGTVCWYCGGVVSADIALSPFAVAVSKTTGETFYETGNSGNQYSASASWTSSSTSVATVNSSGVVTGVKAGALTVYADDLSAQTVPGEYCTQTFSSCPTWIPNAQAPGTVLMISSVSPAPLVIGSSGPMTIYGSGFSGKGAPVPQLDGAGIVTIQSVQNDTTIQATYSATCSAGAQNLTLNFPSFDNVSTDPFPLSVALPAAPTPTIKLAGNNISGTQSAVVDQQIALSASYSLPACTSVNSQSWSVPGSLTGGFAHNDTSGGPTAYSLNGQSTTFYWYSTPNYAQASYQVAFTLNLSDGRSPSATANFKVAGTSTPSGIITPGSVVVASGNLLQYLGPNGLPGMTFHVALSLPPSGYSGIFTWDQIRTDSWVRTSGTTSRTCIAPSNPPGLSTTQDGSYPYDTRDTTLDSPYVRMLATDTETSRTFSAKMYAMWDPNLPNSIPVPLGYVQWNFSGDATITNATTNQWTLKSGSAGSNNAFTPSSSYIQWSGTSTAGETCH